MAYVAVGAAAIANLRCEGERLNLANNRAVNSRFHIISSNSQLQPFSSQYKRETEFLKVL